MCVKVFTAFVLCRCVVCTICLWKVRLQACPFVRPCLLTKLIIIKVLIMDLNVVFKGLMWF